MRDPASATGPPTNANVPLARIAEEVGHQTDPAFNRAFKREFGAPPDARSRSFARK